MVGVMKYSEAEEERQKRIAENARRIADRGDISGVFEIPTRRIRGLGKSQLPAAAEVEP